LGITARPVAVVHRLGELLANSAGNRRSSDAVPPATGTAITGPDAAVVGCDNLIWPRRASLNWPHPRSTSP